MQIVGRLGVESMLHWITDVTYFTYSDHIRFLFHSALSAWWRRVLSELLKGVEPRQKNLCSTIFLDMQINRNNEINRQFTAAYGFRLLKPLKRRKKEVNSNLIRNINDFQIFAGWVEWDALASSSWLSSLLAVVCKREIEIEKFFFHIKCCRAELALFVSSLIYTRVIYGKVLSCLSKIFASHTWEKTQGRWRRQTGIDFGREQRRKFSDPAKSWLALVSAIWRRIGREKKLKKSLKCRKFFKYFLLQLLNFSYFSLHSHSISICLLEISSHFVIRFRFHGKRKSRSALSSFTFSICVCIRNIAWWC